MNVPRTPEGLSNLWSSLCHADADCQAQHAAQQEVATHSEALPHLCRVLRVANASRVAIVGSTALSAAERHAFQTADAVLCFDSIDMRQASLRSNLAECDVSVASVLAIILQHDQGYNGRHHSGLVH